MIHKSLILGFQGTSESDLDVRFLKYLLENKKIMGVILFKHNIQNPTQLKKLIDYLKVNTSCLIAVDQEGGAVSRLSPQNGFPLVMPAAKDYRSAEHVYEIYYKMSMTLKELGINCNFAPVVDIDHDPPCPVIGSYGRSFSKDPQVVIDYAKAALIAMREAGISACLKHFPGHGSAKEDTHLSFTDVTAYWSPQELTPFRVLKDEVPYIMASHIFNAKIDAQYPASVSKKTYELLEKFVGEFITDDYFMAAVAKKFSPATFGFLALAAGASKLIYSLNPSCLKALNQPLLSVQAFYDAFCYEEQELLNKIL